MGRSRYKVLQDHHTYFATCTVVNWLPLFSKPDLAQIILDSLQFLNETERLILHAYVIMENHLHLIGSSHDFSSQMKNFKSFTARRLVDFLSQSGPHSDLKKLAVFRKRHKADQDFQVWQEGYHPEAILNEGMLRTKIDYIHHNPVRRGYVELPEYWRYSSAGQYAGLAGLLRVEIVE
jgi:putative transposase